MNQINMELDSTAIRAAMEKQSPTQSKAHRAATWNEIERMQAESMIQQVSKTEIQRGKLAEYQEEMQAFTTFLKEQYFV